MNTTAVTNAVTPAVEYWKAPACIARLQQYGGNSSWSIFYSIGEHGYRARPLNHLPPAFKIPVSERAKSAPHVLVGRTPGRALRNVRRFLSRNPVVFD